MAFTASDGSKHTNHSSYKAQEARVKAKSPKPQSNPAPEEGQDDEMGDPQDGTAMAQEHGPAMQVAIDHDHENNMHHVHVLHQDGHEHETEHGSAGEAHKFAADCAGGGM
jgi:hypothetical protein